MERPKVSVIVPVYKVEKYIDRCLQSIINQTLSDIEIILVEDGSPDNCKNICDEYVARDNRIKVIHKENGGLSSARNAGIEIAMGEYIAFADSDDYVDTTIYEKLYSACKKDNADTGLSGFYRVKNCKKIEPRPNPLGGNVYANKSILNDVLVNMMGSEPSYHRDNFVDVAVWMGIYSRNLIIDNNIKFCSERELISEDAIFCIDYMPYSRRLSIISDPLYYYCENIDSLTTTYRKDRFVKNKILYMEELRRLSDIGIINQAKLRVSRLFIANIRCCIIQEVANVCNSGLKKTIKNINDICEDEMTQDVLANYPYNKLPIKQRIFSIFMKIKCPRILYALARLHELSSKV